TSTRPRPSWVNCPISEVCAALVVADAAGSAANTPAGNALSSATEIARISTQLLDAFGGTDHVGQANTELFVHHHHLAVGNQRSVDLYVKRLAGQPVEFDHRALIELQQVANGDFGVTHLHRDRHWNIQNDIQI